MNIGELDKDKVEQCIVNETRRLEEITENLEKLRAEYERKKTFFVQVVLVNMEDKILTLESSQAGAKKFIEDCQNRLNQLNN